ncbi:MAG TPA: glutaredoxin family protein [Burkholderiales bacterium]
MKRAVLAWMLAVGAVAAAAQTMYRWTDEKGRLHVTDTPPPPGAKQVQPRGAPAAPAESAPAAAPEPYALQLARKSFPVTLYTGEGCEACDEARKLLNARGIPFSEVFVNNEQKLEELKQAVGSNSVPSMIVGATVQKGFESGAYHRTLDAAGYPKAGVLPPRNQGEPQSTAPGAEVKPVPAEAPLGPYAPGSAPQPRAPKTTKK